MEWVLYIVEAMNAQNGIELARYETKEQCQKGAMTLWLAGDAIARSKRGDDEAADLYGKCWHKEDPSRPKQT